MMKILGERKAAAARLAELIGERAVYTKLPRCAYEVGPFAIERDGSVTAFESSNLAPLRTLALEGLLEGWEEHEEEIAADASEAATGAQEAATQVQEDTDGSESATGPQKAVAEVENDAPDALTISLPLTGHTANSLRNLVTMIYSRGPLISKATGGHFTCPLEHVDSLKDCLTVSDAVARITDALTGIVITTDKITFTFPATDDADKVKAFTQLAAQMNRLAKEQKRTQAKAVDSTNERYIFRIWLLALGMGGDDFKTARRVLLAPLSGNAAFKDQAMELRWKEKQAAKRTCIPVTEETTTE